MIKGVHRLIIPTPFAIGSINSYLIDDDPLTLIDIGPATEDALNSLKEQLNNLGYLINDIKRVILTHAHPDHAGLAGELQEDYDLEVYGFREELLFFKGNFYYGDWGRGVMLKSFLEWGVPEKVFIEMEKHFINIGKYSRDVEVTHIMEENEIIEFKSSSIKVFHTPGHTIGNISLYDEDKKILFSGDHLLKHITPVPLLDFKKGEKSLINFLRALKKIKELDIDIVLPGHGDPIDDCKEYINSLFIHHEKRKLKIYRIINEGSKTPYDICKRLFGELPMGTIFLGISEVIGHLEILEMEGKANRYKDNGLIYFSRVK
jgi:glyoxylase-like metal-dependent hydrolase (beta-lactamase superfamily II)